MKAVGEGAEEVGPGPGVPGRDDERLAVADRADHLAGGIAGRRRPSVLAAGALQHPARRNGLDDPGLHIGGGKRNTSPLHGLPRRDRLHRIAAIGGKAIGIRRRPGKAEPPNPADTHFRDGDKRHRDGQRIGAELGRVAHRPALGRLTDQDGRDMVRAGNEVTGGKGKGAIQHAARKAGQGAEKGPAFTCLQTVRTDIARRPRRHFVDLEPESAGGAVTAGKAQRVVDKNGGGEHGPSELRAVDLAGRGDRHAVRRITRRVVDRIAGIAAELILAQPVPGAVAALENTGAARAADQLVVGHRVVRAGSYPDRCTLAACAAIVADRVLRE